jgi:hypothetical protein
MLLFKVWRHNENVMIIQELPNEDNNTNKKQNNRITLMTSSKSYQTFYRVGIQHPLQKTRHLLTWLLFTFFATLPFPNVSKVQTLVNVFFFFGLI